MDRLRLAARLAVEARSHGELGRAAAELAGAMQSVGLGNWRRFTAHAEERAIEAVSRGEVPGVVKTSGESAGIGLGAAVLLFLGTLHFAGRAARQGDAPSPEAPGIVRQHAPKEKTPSTGPTLKGEGDQQAEGSDYILTDDRRKYILEGNGKGGGGHRHGTGVPGKSEFPADWSDDKIIDAILSIAKDKTLKPQPGDGGRTLIKGTRDGVDITIVIGRDGRTIVTAHPTNTPTNPTK